ncbi:BMP family ABC transporter substrate-binding protein [Aerococcaceae bacterium DSM 111022]|nr:BMP family ABC transporter substrate-binding protein [Aerococcaceae bacterium DSM 111022]
MAGLALLGALAPMAAKAQEEENDLASVVMITDIGGVDDKSFNQSAWEGITQYGEDNGLERGAEGYDYIQSDSDSDFINNINTAMQANFDLIFGIGYKLEPAINQTAQQFRDKNFIIVDATSEEENVATINFKDHEASFLAGVAAAMTTETDHLGFVGGVEGVVIDRFEAGFVAGAKAVNPDIEITVEYAGSFGDASAGKQIAAAMYANDADIIFHASGDTGNGVFSEAKDLVTNDPSRNLWVIGVDRDQDEEGIVEVDGEERHLTLTSTLKEVGNGILTFIDQTNENGFEATHAVYGLEDGGVDLTEGQLTDEVKEAVAEYRQQIIDGEIEVPETPER